MIEFIPYSEEIKEEVLKLKVSKSQLPFVGLIECIINFPEKGADTYIIKVENEFIGTFSLDRCYSEKYDFIKNNVLGFRAFFIDKKFQGMGYGKETMNRLFDLLDSKYSNFNGITLTVNCKNISAYNLYKKSGFVDSGELYRGGLAGPQHIMRCKIK